LTITSLNSHVICTDPQLLIEERLKSYKSIPSRRNGSPKLGPFVICKAEDPTGSGLSARECEREKAALNHRVAVFMGIYL